MEDFFGRKRAHRRKRIDMAVRLQVMGEDDKIRFLKAITINSGGMFLGSKQTIEKGKLVKLSFRLPDEAEAIETMGKVVSVKEESDKGERDGPAGIGFKFISLNAKAIDAIEGYLQKLE